MRLPSVFFGMLSLATVYKLSLLGGRQEAGLAAAGFLVFLSFFLYYTQIARMYTLLALVTGGIVWSYWESQPRRRARLDLAPALLSQPRPSPTYIIPA